MNFWNYKIPTTIFWFVAGTSPYFLIVFVFFLTRLLDPWIGSDSGLFFLFAYVPIILGTACSPFCFIFGLVKAFSSHSNIKLWGIALNLGALSVYGYFLFNYLVLLL